MTLFACRVTQASYLSIPILVRAGWKSLRYSSFVLDSMFVGLAAVAAIDVAGPWRDITA
jgi:hypothetical protein